MPDQELQAYERTNKPQQAIVKVYASWKLYEHSNGFRAKNFYHSLKMWKNIRKIRKLAALRQYGFLLIPHLSFMKKF